MTARMMGGMLHDDGYLARADAPPELFIVDTA
jgi:hypothetical protein